MRDGTVQALVGLFEMQANARIRATNKATMLSALATEPADILALLTADQRATVRQELARAIKIPGVANRAALEAFARAMDATPCTNACLIP